MEGWLKKKKSKSGLFHHDSRRWFKIQRLEGDENELALCYFASNKVKDAKGWIFLNDIEEISEDKSTITIVSAARTMTVEAQTIGEHRLWLTALVKLCPNARYNGDTAAKYRADMKSTSRSSGEGENKDSERDKWDRRSSSRERDQSRQRRSVSRENSLDRDRNRNTAAIDGETLSKRVNSSRDDDSDEDRRGRAGSRERDKDRAPRRSYQDDSSAGSSGSRGRASRVPNTNDDHRKGGNPTYPDASTAARMHSHISGEPDTRIPRGRPPPAPDRSRQQREGDHSRLPHDSHHEDFDLEEYDMNKASQLLSREERLQLSKEDELNERERRHSQDKAVDEEVNPQIVKRKKPAPPPTMPPKRYNSPTREEKDDGENKENKFEDSDPDDEDYLNAPPDDRKKHTTTIDDMIKDDNFLSIHLDDSDDEEKFDFKAEKMRYGVDSKSLDDRQDNAKSKPPLAPPKNSTRNSAEPPAKGGPSSSHNAGSNIDPNFLEDDWDADMESPPKQKGKNIVQTGSQADSNWLDEDFDD